MKKRNRNLLHMLLCCVLALAMVFSCGCSEKVEETPEAPEEPVAEVAAPVYDGPEGYVAAEPCGTGFVACGTGGRLDYIDISGEVTQLETGTTENLHDVFVEGENIAVCGDYGTVLISNDEGKTFRSVDVGVKDHFSAVAAFAGHIFVAGMNGTIYRDDAGSWTAIEMEQGNELIDLVATDYCVAAITEETNVYISTDGMNWMHQNFNEYYDGLYPAYVFTGAVPAGETLFILGYHKENPNVPLMMYTEVGEVWMHKEITYLNGQPVEPETMIRINDISFNIDQIVGVMDDGQVLAITECVTCNEIKEMKGAGDLFATAAQDDGVLLCGEDFYAQVVKSSQIRQDKIGAEQAKVDIGYYGAVLIDVREADELAADGYIPGSIHVPSAEVEARLPELVPELTTEIIFYCASGKRSQTATELAVEMGYLEVYNLGGLSDWPYEIVKD